MPSLLPGIAGVLSWLTFGPAESAARRHVIGIIPELKHSTWFRAAGLPLEECFVSTL